MDKPDRAKILKCASAALLYFFILTYALGIDPKIRMMIPSLISSIFIISIIITSPRHYFSTLLSAIILSCHLLLCFGLLWTFHRPKESENVAAMWMSDYTGQIRVDRNSRRHLTFVPSVREAPGLDADKSLLLIAHSESCGRFVKKTSALLPQARILKEAPNRRLKSVGEAEAGSLCLLYVGRNTSRARIESAIRLAHKDVHYML